MAFICQRLYWIACNVVMVAMKKISTWLQKQKMKKKISGHTVPNDKQEKPNMIQ